MWRTAAGLLALMGQPGVGPAGAVRRAADQQVDDLDAAAMDTALHDAQERVADAERCGIDVITYFDDRFPQQLRSVPSAPAVLWVRGNVQALHEDLVAVVGTRSPSAFGRVAADVVTSAAAEAGVGCVSGLALGVDAVSHETALRCGARTVAVLAGGVGEGEIHPAGHSALAARIIRSGGCLVSENPPGTETLPRLLVARNRLQSGLALATVVVQTGLTGGTPHTARYSLAQRRPLFCPVPRERNDGTAGNWALLEAPGRTLPDMMPAFRDARGLCNRLADQPAASGITRQSAAAWASALRRGDEHEPSSLF